MAMVRRTLRRLIATLAATEAAALQQQVETTLLLFDPQEPTEEGGGHRTSKRPRYTNGFVLQGHNVRSMDHVGQVVLLFETAGHSLGKSSANSASLGGDRPTT